MRNEHWTGEFATQRRDWLLAQAKCVCRNDTDADDLVQEAVLRFIQSFKKVEACPSERSCEAWLVTTLTNLFFDQCRRKKVQKHVVIDTDLSSMALVAPEAAPQPVYDAITDEQFAQAVHALSPKVRATFEMHAAGKKYQDIARSLGIPVGTVAKRLHDARAKLRQLLHPDTTHEFN